MANNANFDESAHELAHQNLHCLQNQAMSPPAWEWLNLHKAIGVLKSVTGNKLPSQGEEILFFYSRHRCRHRNLIFYKEYFKTQIEGWVQD